MKIDANDIIWPFKIPLYIFILSHKKKLSSLSNIRGTFSQFVKWVKKYLKDNQSNMYS